MLDVRLVVVVYDFDYGKMMKKKKNYGYVKFVLSIEKDGVESM